MISNYADTSNNVLKTKTSYTIKRKFQEKMNPRISHKNLNVPENNTRVPYLKEIILRRENFLEIEGDPSSKIYVV